MAPPIQSRSRLSGRPALKSGRNPLYRPLATDGQAV
jgi:hypothetical protein